MRKLLPVLITALLLFGCSKTEEEAVITEINDYNGAVERIARIKHDVEDTLAGFSDVAESYRMEHPTDYWGDSYVTLSPEVMDLSVFEHTENCNEEQLPWADTYNVMHEAHPKDLIERNSAHDYSVAYTYDLGNDVYVVTEHARYDATRDWLKLERTERDYYRPENEAWIGGFEYIRLGNGMFALQNENSRLLAEYGENGLVRVLYAEYPYVIPQEESVFTNSDWSEDWVKMEGYTTYYAYCNDTLTAEIPNSFTGKTDRYVIALTGEIVHEEISRAIDSEPDL